MSARSPTHLATEFRGCRETVSLFVITHCQKLGVSESGDMPQICPQDGSVCWDDGCQREYCEYQLAKKWAACDHADRTGGNDYMLCNKCWFEWDWRKDNDGRKSAVAHLIVAADAVIDKQLTRTP